MALKRCHCKRKMAGDAADFQDKRYGKGIRVHNETTSKAIGAGPDGGWRCTVCGEVKPK